MPLREKATPDVRSGGWIYVLHAWNKKSKKGIATDKADIGKIKDRLAEAHARHKALG